MPHRRFACSSKGEGNTTMKTLVVTAALLATLGVATAFAQNVPLSPDQTWRQQGGDPKAPFVCQRVHTCHIQPWNTDNNGEYSRTEKCGFTNWECKAEKSDKEARR